MAVPKGWSITYGRNPHNQTIIVNASDVRAICPYCNIATTFNVASQDFVSSGNQTEIRLILKCGYAPCRRTVYVQTSLPNGHTGNLPNDDFLMYPSRSTSPAHPSIPTAIADDWKEAQVALEAGAVKGAAVMFRRVLYGVLLDKGCKLFPLKDGLADLIKNERLPAIFDDWLPAIRDDGHDAAHPDRALQVSSENVAETMDYTGELLRYLYIEPYDFKQRKLRNTQPASTPTGSSSPQL